MRLRFDKLLRTLNRMHIHAHENGTGGRTAARKLFVFKHFSPGARPGVPATMVILEVE